MKLILPLSLFLISAYWFAVIGVVALVAGIILGIFWVTEKFKNPFNND